MRAPSPFLILFAAICIVAAGCSGGSGPGIPLASNGVSQTASNAASLDAAVAPDNGTEAQCGRRQGCPAKLVAPLTFDGKTFSIPANAGRCSHVSLTGAKPYTAPGNKQFVLKSNVALRAVCSANLAGSRLFIAGTQLHSNKLLLVGGPAEASQKTWRYAPVGNGIALIAKKQYTFFIIAMPKDYPYPSPAPSESPTGNYVLLQPLNYDGTTFTPVANSCFQGDPYNAPPYVAPTSGPLALSGTVSIAPTCVPSPLPSISPMPVLYVVALPLGSGDSVKHRSAHRLVPMDYGLGVPATAIAGPVNVTDNPWNFVPDSPGLEMAAGQSYVFFIAAALPAPSPSTTAAPYDAIVPLDFDGANFTVASFSSCSSIGTPAPYTPSASGPLTLSAAVTVTPTCAPSSSGGSGGGYGGDVLVRMHHNDGGYGGGGGYGYGSSGQLYIIATTCPPNGGGSYGGGGGDNAKHHHDGGGYGYGNCSSSGGYGSGGGDNAKHANDGGGYGYGNCGSSSGGGDDAKHANDGGGGYGYGNGCTIVIGNAVAGPVNATDNPWNFTPLSPALNLVAGTQYYFYIGVSNGDGNGGGGDN